MAVLSPFLFATIIDCLTKKIQREKLWDMLFAHDLIICGETNEEIESRLECGDVQWKIVK